ncbi:efflux transporter periplasmic adaptor subunit, partial [Pseudomonas sp. MWU13-2625]
MSNKLVAPFCLVVLAAALSACGKTEGEQTPPPAKVRIETVQ